MKTKDTRKEILQGNEACTKAAIYAGCRFFAGYPITPSTEIIETMALEMPKAEGAFIQMEDEIASACAAVGARWAGKKAMTATSGPGFTLMQETIGYGAVTETPMVIVNVQRGGPSTGQPTLSSQQDIYAARYGSHGDYEIIALAPASVQEMYDFTVKAFRLSEKFRTPVILLADEVVGHMREKITIRLGQMEIRAGNREYVHSPQDDFFQGCHTLVEGQLHDAEGRRIGHLAGKSGRFIQAINRKITDHIEEIQDIESHFMEDGEIAVIAYGSPARSALAAVKSARRMKLKAGLIKLNSVWPFPEKELQRLAGRCRVVIVPEMNIGKYYKEVERCLKRTEVISFPKLGGEIHKPGEILDVIEKYSQRRGY